MKTLFLNTTTEWVSIAIFEHDQQIAQRNWKSHRDEAERIQIEVKKLFRKVKRKPDHIDRIAVCIGPAGFTSARIGVSIANAWSFAMHIPLAQFSVFDCYPENAMVVIPCNRAEAWVREPGEEPRLLVIDMTRKAQGKCFSKSFVRRHAQERMRDEHGGRGLEKSSFPVLLSFPNPSTLNFSHQLAHPWYYKDAKITIPCSTSSQPPSATLKT